MITIIIWSAILDADFNHFDNLDHDFSVNWDDREEYSDFLSADSLFLSDSVEHLFNEENMICNDSTDPFFTEWYKQDTSLEYC